jgi:uncharacterized protein (DUF488 family)
MYPHSGPCMGRSTLGEHAGEHDLATIGYEGASVRTFLDALEGASVELLVDVRAVANSRRPGFAKSSLSGNLADAGIDYLHLRGLGTPAEGRAAARAGRHDEMKRVFGQHLLEPDAQRDLASLVDLIASGRRICLLCLEADPAHCHRTLVAEAVGGLVPVRIQHLRAVPSHIE